MKYFALMALSVASMATYAQNSHSLKGKIESVTVYFNGASVVQSARTSLPVGTHTLVFENLPANIDQAKTSIQVQENMYVLSMNKTLRTPEENDKEPQVKRMWDSISLVGNLQQACKYRIEALNTELALLKENLYIGGANTGVNIAELQKATDLYRTRQDDIYKKLLAENILSTQLTEIATYLESEKEWILYDISRLNGRVSIQVKVTKEGQYELKLTYFTPDAAWKPIYDIRVADVGKPMDLVQKGKILNNTGQDWKNVDMLLSTADPSLSIIRPELTVWELEPNSAKNKGRYSKPYSPDDVKDVIQGYISMSNSSVAIGDQTAGMGSTVVYVSELSNEFTIPEPVNITSGMNPQTIEIKTYTLNAWYEYTGIPKIEKMPYLIAKTTDWKTIPLSDGPANIYIGNNYIGESYIDMGSVTDTLEISMGRNKKVAVDYRMKQDMTKKAWLGGNITETFTYEINIKNNNSVDIPFELWDQVPVSKDNDISVSVIEISGAMKDDATGKLTWKMVLKPGEERKIIISFSVKYPKSKQVQVTRMKALTCPNF